MTELWELFLMLVFLIYGKLCCGGGGFRRPASWSASIGASKDFHAILFFAKGFCILDIRITPSSILDIRITDGGACFPYLLLRVVY